MFKVFTVNRQDLMGGIRECLTRLPPPYESHYGVVPPAPPESGVYLDEITALHSQAMVALGQIAEWARASTDPYLISRTLRSREAVSSSAMEGTHSTLDELLIVDEDDEQATQETRQVRDYALALEKFLPLAAASGKSVFTLDTVLALHREVMKHDSSYIGTPGALRTTVVWIGGSRHNIAYSTYNPPPPDRVPQCLQSTLDYMAGDSMQMMTQSLITRIAIAHAHFEAVHPFRDGNGRVGRLLIPMMLAAEQEPPLYLSSYIEAYKQDYYDALKQAQQKLNWLPLIAFMSQAIIGTVREFKAVRSAIKALKTEWLGRRSYRKNSAALRALDVLIDCPVITATRLGKILDISAPATKTALEQLQAAGILVERTGYARNRIFSAPEVMAIINRPFGERELDSPA